MPTYQYVCTDCQSDLEAVQTFQEPSLSICPSCGGKLRKRFGAVGVVFKGSGFYRNDSRGDGHGASSAGKPDGEKAPAAETKTEAKTETKTETKSELAAKSSPSSGSGSSSSGSGVEGHERGLTPPSTGRKLAAVAPRLAWPPDPGGLMSTAQQALRAWRGELAAAAPSAPAAGRCCSPLAGVLFGLSSLKTGPRPPSKAAASPSAALLSALRPGQVAAPVRLVDPGVAPLLHAGESVDVLAVADSPAGPAAASQTVARIVAAGVQVLAVPPATSDSSLGTLVVLAVSRADAQALAGAEAGGRLSVTLEPG